MPPYKCPFCAYTSTSTGNVSNHKKRMHSGTKSHVCAVPGCMRAFAMAPDLRRHATTHTGERVLACPHACGYNATNRNSMSAHAVKCPLGQGAAPPGTAVFACGMGGCCFTALRRYAVLDHQRRMHNSALGGALACKICAFVTEVHEVLMAHVQHHSGMKRVQARAAAAAAAAALRVTEERDI
jgi:hypothetical protein